jgi:hypothetical protein
MRGFEAKLLLPTLLLTTIAIEVADLPFPRLLWLYFYIGCLYGLAVFFDRWSAKGWKMGDADETSPSDCEHISVETLYGFVNTMVDDIDQLENELDEEKEKSGKLYSDLAGWLSLARRQYAEMPHNEPTCPHIRGINETEKLLNVELTKRGEG